MRIAIVNDLMLAVEALRRVVTSIPEYEIAWLAYNGKDAIIKCMNDKPDLILMDLIMPVMDGVEATAAIMKNCPCAILIVTASVRGNASKVFDAMGYGALDATRTPSLGTGGNLIGGEELLKKIAIISKLIGKDIGGTKYEISFEKPSFGKVPTLIAIGSSTGGPKALSEILSRLTKNINAAVVIVQHVDSQFASGLADWLNDQTELEVMLIREGMRPEINNVYLAGTDDHLVIGADAAFHYTPEPSKYPYRPSVDTFFFSLQKYWKKNDIAVLLTGMGSDGAKGLLALQIAGWHTIAQDEQSSVVYGMPKAAVELGAAKEILSLENISKAIIKFTQKKGN